MEKLLFETACSQHPWAVLIDITNDGCIGYPESEDAYLTTNSADFHSHLGYVEIGRFHKCGHKFNTWYDMIWMEKIIGEHKDSPAPITKYQSALSRKM